MSEAANDIRPFARQMDALECPAYELLYGGTKGGGKSLFLLMCWGYLLDAAKQRFISTAIPQIQVRIVIFRKNLKDLKDLIIKSHQVFKAVDPLADYNQNDKTWRFPFGATVEFAHLDGPDDHRGWNGNEIMGMGFDQVEELAEEAYSWLTAQVRTPEEYYKPYLRVRATANPGGRHGDWVKRRFIDPFPDGNRIISVEVENADGAKKAVTRAYIPSALKDNPFLNADGAYEARLRATLPEHLVKQWLDGDWNAVEGAFFGPSIVPHVHSMTWREFLAKSPGGIPPSWDLGFGLDWGAAMSSRAATLFMGRDSDDRVWCFDELYIPGQTGRYYGEQLRKKVGGQNWNINHRWQTDDFYGMVDTEAWARFGADGAAPADTISSMGFRLFPANKDRKAGIEQIMDRLRVRADGMPGLIIIRDQCPHLWRTFQTVRIDTKNPENYDMHDEAHAVDAMRFKLMDWPINLHAPTPKEDLEMQKWNQILRNAQKRQRAEGYDSTGGYD